MIDICVNICSPKFKSADFVVSDSKAKGLTGLILTGTDLKSSVKCSKLALSDVSFLNSTAGVHPHKANSYSDEVHNHLIDLLNFDHVVAVGECGLDFNRNYSSKSEQIYAFEKQLELARLSNKPLFLHERDAHKDFINIMRVNKDLIPKSVVHCFTGNRYHLDTYIKMGFMIGITGWICDKKRGKDLREAIKILPLERLMIETDAPHLTPKNIDSLNFVNMPSNVIYIAEEIAHLKGVSVESVIESSVKNTINFFGLKI